MSGGAVGSAGGRGAGAPPVYAFFLRGRDDIWERVDGSGGC